MRSTSVILVVDFFTVIVLVTVMANLPSFNFVTVLWNSFVTVTVVELLYLCKNFTCNFSQC